MKRQKIFVVLFLERALLVNKILNFNHWNVSYSSNTLLRVVSLVGQWCPPFHPGKRAGGAVDPRSCTTDTGSILIGLPEIFLPTPLSKPPIKYTRIFGKKNFKTFDSISYLSVSKILVTRQLLFNLLV